jgi:alpha-L-rhamnosidase
MLSNFFTSIEISNWQGELQASQIIAEAVNTNIKISAEFETSSQLLNDINRICRRSQLDNMHGGIAIDCPHRERSAYTCDAQAACAMVMQNFNARNFYHKWMHDILGAQNPETGYVPNAAPWQPGCGGGVVWGAAIAEIPWEFYLQYVSFDMLQDNYEGIKEYIKYMKQWVDDDGIMYSQRVGSDGEPLEWFNLGDWVATDSLPSNKLVHTFYFWRCASIASKIAKILDEKEDANKYERLAEKTKYAFQAHFYNQELETYGNYGQNVFALIMGVPKEQEAKVVAALKGNIEKNDGHLDTGIFGIKFLFELLSDYGMHELAYDVLTKKTYPGFGHWLAQGAATTCEQWNGDNSRNHPMFGGGLVWMYRKLAVMNADPMNPGYKHIIFKPQFIKEVDFVSYSNETPYGKAGISWKKKGEKRELDIIIPVSSTATVYLPIKDVNQLKESGELMDQIKEIQVVSFDSDKIILSMGSGEFFFEF